MYSFNRIIMHFILKILTHIIPCGLIKVTCILPGYDYEKRVPSEEILLGLGEAVGELSNFNKFCSNI